jgi:hypothetical protein
MPPSAGDAAADFIETRVERLRRWLVEAGLGDPEAAALAATDAPAVRAEMAALEREALWHARQIAYQAVQFWPELASRSASTTPRAASAWVALALTPSGVA